MFNTSPSEIESDTFSLSRFTDRSVSYSSGGKIIFTEFPVACITAETFTRYSNNVCDLNNPDVAFDCDNFNHSKCIANLSLHISQKAAWLVVTDDDDWILHSPEMPYHEALRLYCQWPTTVSYGWLISKGFH